MLPLLIGLVAFIILYIILNLPVHWMWKLALSLSEMAIVGELLIRKFGFSGSYGIILLKSKRGLDAISHLAANKRFWAFFCDVGAVAAYGALSLVLLEKRPSFVALAAGFLLLTLLVVVVAPLILPFLSYAAGLDIPEKAQQVAKESTIFLTSTILIFGGGIFALILFSIVLYSITILSALYSTFMVGTAAIAGVSPGVTPLLPGINLPLFEGILSLIVILVVHEGAHAVLARIARVPILHSGIVLFGVIPIGAFVEPDEEKLKRAPRDPQTKVLIAGSTGNLVASLVFFVLFIAFIYFARQYTDPEASRGLVLVRFTQPWMNFIYMVLGLSFTLNFAIGSVNLLPLPFFDGHRILEINIKNKKIVEGLTIITALAFLTNLLPWLFR